MPAGQETKFRSVGQGDPLEKGTAIYSSTLSWEFHGQGSLAGYSPWSCKGLDTTERLTLSLCHMGGRCFCRVMPYNMIRFRVFVTPGRLGVAEVLRCREKLAIKHFMNLLSAGSAKVQDAIPVCMGLQQDSYRIYSLKMVYVSDSLWPYGL